MDTANIWQCPEVTVKCFLLSRFQRAIDQQETLGEIPFNLIGGTILKNGQDAREARDEFDCGTGILPVPKQVIENGAIFPLNRSKDSARVVYVSAIALKLAKTWQQTPQTIGTELAETLKPLCYPDFAVKVAPEGIIEMELTDAGLAVWLQRLAQTNLPVSESRILSSAVCADRLFPIQYSHARCCSLLRMAHRDRIIAIAQPDVATAPQIWFLASPNPIPWIDEGDRLRLVHPAERRLISQLLTVLDNLYPTFEVNKREKPVNYFKLANSLSEAFQIFYSQCRIWGEVKIEQPKLAQARLGLILATQSLLRFILENLFNAIAPLEL
ncbi:DALR anticodon binding domain protein [Oscillatoria nigro-viridis PCC 7112]|uniref:DALR anticodon binding domain protein n=1 Tax=Phormidium nigroviride PCC 7112 TaxID=179408 RepID=K9VBK4_9CYAN|nr:DALR anticodon-binding domain-containing protein [Oscillatoria nigro-viridis]AFZ05251.1 DALR anticodon binding domain protein [Oscillatoria nigro-viridis PCC 7112]